MTWYSFLSALQLGLAAAPLSIGAYIAFRVLRYPDLTCEGSFALGGALTAVMLSQGIHPILTMLSVGVAGASAGMITGTISERLKVPQIVAGILTYTALYSVNLALMQRPVISLGSSNSLFKLLRTAADAGGLAPDSLKNIAFDLGVLALAVLALFVVLAWFFSTEIGLRLRAAGANANLAPAVGINVKNYTVGGLALVNICIASSGGLNAQLQKFADINMGFGMLILSLAGVYIGQVLESRILKTHRLAPALLCVVVGAVVYQIIVQLAYAAGVDTVFFNLLSAGIVLSILLVPMVKEGAFRAITRSQ